MSTFKSIKTKRTHQESDENLKKGIRTGKVPRWEGEGDGGAMIMKLNGGVRSGLA